MTLHIQPVADIDSSELRTLVLDNLGALLGDGARLVDNMPPIDGCCLVMPATGDGPVLISFDASDPQQALLTGLSWMDQLGGDLVARFLQGYRPPTALLVLAPAAPPGLRLFGESCPVSWRHIQVLRVNGETGMMIGPVAEGAAAAAPTRPEPLPTVVEPVLNAEEEQHFSQL